MTTSAPPPFLLHADGLRLGPPGHGLAHELPAFSLGPGLSLAQGGDGRGKTTLLAVLAGERPPAAGHIRRGFDGPAFWAGTQPPPEGREPLRQWIASAMAPHAGADMALAADLTHALGLDEHLDKSLFMLSTGTRRKGLLAAGFASGAALTLLDTPFAALDGRSREVVEDLLREASHHPRRAFVMADHGLPPGLRDLRLSAVVDLGD